MPNETYKRVMITFRLKDQRRQREVDKVALLRSVVKEPIDFIEPGNLPPHGECRLHRKLGIDINRYQVPILMACLTESEIVAVKALGDVECITDDMGEVLRKPEELAPEVLKSDHQAIPDGVQRVAAPAAWKVARGAGVRVAVIDGGIELDHPDLAANCVDSVVLAGPEQVQYSHGTMCAGTIAAIDNAVGVVGVAPDAKLLSVKAGALRLDPFAIIAGIEWCLARRVDIINFSAEFRRGHSPPMLERMCNLAYSMGRLIVASSGEIDGPPPDEAAAELSEPARYESVIAVAALTDQDEISAISARGNKVELCAPGENVLSTARGGNYARESGTSRAAPHVCGAAAVVWSANPNLRNTDVRKILQQSADVLGGGKNPRFGYGRVNVARAVDLARRWRDGTSL